MKLTPHQTMRLQNVTTADNEYRRARIDADAVARKAKEDYIAKFLFERDRAVRLAVNDGVPKNQILQSDRGLHTTAGVTLRDSLARTIDLLPTLNAEETDPYAARYELLYDADDYVLRITLTPAELEEAVRAVNYDASVAGPAPTSARFIVTSAGRLDSKEGMTVGDSFERHPVVAWAYAPEHEAEALAWLAEQTMEAAA